MLVSGPGIPPGTRVQSSSGTTVTLTAPVLDDVPAGSVITFTPAYTADLQALVKSWLAYPPSAASGLPSSGTYQPADDASNFWPGAATANPAAFLNLVLAAVTQGYVIPAPFDVALGTQMTAFLAALPGAPSPPTVSTLASVTAEQWIGFFQQNPTWLPPFTEPGNTAARTTAFISAVQNLFPVGTSGPSSAIVFATTAPTASGDDAAVRIHDRDRAGHDRHRAGHSARHDRPGGDVHQRDADRAGRGRRRVHAGQHHVHARLLRRGHAEHQRPDHGSANALFFATTTGVVAGMTGERTGHSAGRHGEQRGARLRHAEPAGRGGRRRDRRLHHVHARVRRRVRAAVAASAVGRLAGEVPVPLRGLHVR